jgi:hypothetical protein
VIFVFGFIFDFSQNKKNQIIDLKRNNVEGMTLLHKRRPRFNKTKNEKKKTDGSLRTIWRCLQLLDYCAGLVHLVHDSTEVVGAIALISSPSATA